MEDKSRIENLKKYVERIKDNGNGRELYLEYNEEIEGVKPQDAFEVFYSLLSQGTQSQEILIFLDKIINVFFKSLSSYEWKRPENDNFLIDLQLENQALIEKIDNIKGLLKEEDLSKRKEILLPAVEELKEFDHHYLKKENILFPYMEKVMDKFNGLKIMWALHDKVREQIDLTIETLKDKNSTEHGVNVEVANLFFAILGVVKKEELILFPSASEVLTPKDWYEMHKQSLEYEFPFIHKDKEIENNPKSIESIKEEKGELVFKSQTGELTLEQVLMIFNTLPVEFTFVDEFNKVRFFSASKDRFFPRSPAIIGRDVNNCHPPQSVHIVEEIVESFRSGKEDKASFWINIKKKTLLIQYFALRDNEDKYRGVLEVSQDITEIKSLEGERRLLNGGNK